MKAKKAAVIALLLLITVGFVVYYVPFLGRLTVFSYANSVPIKMGYNPTQNYWMISDEVNENSTFTMVLPSGSSSQINSTAEAQTTSEIGLTIAPSLPTSQTTLSPTAYTYVSSKMPSVVGGGGIPLPGGTFYTKAPAYDIGKQWLTSANYILTALKDGTQIASQNVAVNYQQPTYVQVSTSQGAITVNNLGILDQGVSIPTGDLVAVMDPAGAYHIWSQTDYVNMINAWNSYITSYQAVLQIGYFSWTDVWNWAKSNNKLPSDILLPYISQVSYTADMQYVTVRYSGLAFVPLIAIYIPDSLAETVIINLQTPNPKIVSVTPQTIPTIFEGQQVNFQVTAKNIGTEGTVSVSVSSMYYAFQAVGSASLDMQPNAAATFTFTAYALSVDKDTDTTADILVQGRGGSDSLIITGKILNQAGYTPPPPTTTPDTYLTITLVDGSSYYPIPGIVINLQYGTNFATGTTDQTGLKQWDLGKFQGNLKITIDNQKGYGSMDKVIGVTPGNNAITIPLTENLFDQILDFLKQYWQTIVVATAMATVLLASYAVSKLRKK